MKNLKEVFKEINLIKNLAQKRAHEYMMASGRNRDHFGEYEFQFYTNGGVTFHSNYVNVKFREDTGHDYPEFRNIELSIEQLEMSDEEWDKFIEEQEAERDQKDKEKEEKEKARKLKQKEEEFNKLKEELGK